MQNEKAAFKRLNNAIEKVLNPNPKHISEEDRKKKKERIKHKRAYKENKYKESKKREKGKKRERRQNRVYL